MLGRLRQLSTLRGQNFDNLMQNANKASFVVVLDEATFSAKAEHGYITGTDIVSDVAYALDMWTWEDCELNNDQYLGEAVRQAIKDFDWTRWLRDELNDSWQFTREMLAVAGAGDDADNVCASIEASEYLAGDYLELEEPTMFADIVKDRKVCAEDSLSEVWPYNEEAGAPAELLKELARIRDRLYDDLRHEWLHGDRSNDGVLAMIGKHFDAEVDYNQKDDSLALTFTEESGRDLLGYALADDETLTSTVLTEGVIGHLLRRVATRRQEIARKSAERATEATRRQEREAAELEAKKAAAKKRKKDSQ